MDAKPQSSMCLCLGSLHRHLLSLHVWLSDDFVTSALLQVFWYQCSCTQGCAGATISGKSERTNFWDGTGKDWSTLAGQGSLQGTKTFVGCDSNVFDILVICWPLRGSAILRNGESDAHKHAFCFKPNNPGALRLSHHSAFFFFSFS